MRRLQALSLCLVAVAAAALAGCDGGKVSQGATVSVYAPASLCEAARTVLRQKGWKAGDLQIRLVCLANDEKKGRVDLSLAGANARRATQDSTAVAFLETPSGAAGFTASIVESADLAWIKTRSATATMPRVLRALEERGSSSPRQAVLDEVG